MLTPQIVHEWWNNPASIWKDWRPGSWVGPRLSCEKRHLLVFHACIGCSSDKLLGPNQSYFRNENENNNYL